LEFRDIGREFGGVGRKPHVALEHVSLHVPAGSFTAVVGPSGCGKTTLLNIASGLDSHYAGSFTITPKDGVAACAFQTPRLLPWLSALDNVSFVLESSGVAKNAAHRRASDMLALVGLADVGSRFPGQLSGGMQQRVALARALAVEPALLLMDEPFASLDELTARRLRQELAEVHARTPMTVLFVTHHLQEACFLADRVVVMSGRPGRIVADVDIAVPRPRGPDDPRLAEIAGELLKHIEAHHAGSIEVDTGVLVGGVQ
jgi:NitT/TauT family transport system ATP-binding protein